MNKKDVILGILIGFLANAVGLYFAAMLLGKGDDAFTVIKAASSEGLIILSRLLDCLIGLGAILNLVAFFIFIKKKQDQRAKGVLLATILIAILTFVIKL